MTKTATLTNNRGSGAQTSAGTHLPRSFLILSFGSSVSAAVADPFEEPVELDGLLETGEFLLAGVVPADHTLGMVAPELQWRRTLDVLLDGLRAPGRGEDEIASVPAPA